MNLSDMDSEQGDILHDMCLEPTLEVLEENYRAIALDSNHDVAFGLDSPNNLLFEKMGSGNNEANAGPRNGSHPGKSEASSFTNGPPRLTPPAPQLPSVILCTSSPTYFLPLLTRALELQRCFRLETPKSDLFFGQVMEESKWQWRCSHYSQACSQIELEVSVWDTTGSWLERPVENCIGNFAIELRKMRGDAFGWKRLLAAVKTELLQLDGGFHNPDIGEEKVTPMEITAPKKASESNPKRVAADEASIFDPLVSMMIQTRNKRLQLESLRACNLLLDAGKANLMELINIFNEKTELYFAFSDILHVRSFRMSEPQRIALSILQKIVSESPVARCHMLNDDHSFRFPLERIGQGQRVEDEASISQAKQILMILQG